MRLLPVSATSMLLGGLCLAAPEVASATSLEKAVEAFRSGDCKTALSLIRPILSDPAAPAVAVHAAAVCHAQAGDGRAANVLFRKLARMQPKAWQAWNNLGVNELQLGSTREAITALRKAHELAPSEPGPALNLASAWQRSGDHRAAFRVLDGAQQKMPPNPEVLKGWLLTAAVIAKSAAESITRKEYARALEDLLLVRRPLESEASWQNLTGYAHFRLDHPDPALEHLQKALAIEPDNEDYVLDMAEFLAHHRSYRRLNEIMAVAVQRKPSSLRLQLGFALAHILENRRDEAIPILERVLGTDPKFEPAYSVLAECYHDAGRGADAVRLGRKLQQLRPENPKGWYIEGSALLDAGRRGDADITTAAASLKQSVELDPSFTRARFVLARAYIELGRNADAERELQAVLRADPKHGRAHYVLGRLYQQIGQAEKAKVLLAKHRNLKEEDSKTEYRRLMIETVADGRQNGAPQPAER